MKRRLPLPPAETAIRIRATTPAVNAWVSANAGSGKTSILRDRVIRLLLDGVPPDQILCLTFTRAAAAEMQSRIFSALAAWVAMPDAALSDEIDRLAGTAPDEIARRPKRLKRARSLFAEAVETPGGLKIQTIHGFAERILHLFPIEAKVPVDFSVLDEEDALALREQARRGALEEAIAAPDGALGRAFTTLVSAVGFESYARAIDEALHTLAALRHRGARRQNDAADQDNSYALLLDTNIAQTEAGLARKFVEQFPLGAEAGARAELLRAHARTGASRTMADIFENLAGPAEPEKAVRTILAHCLTGEENIRKILVGKEITTQFPQLAEEATTMAHAAQAYLDRARRLRTAHRSRALTRFAGAVLDRYESAKASRGLLDYTDLIEALRAMLLAGQAAWVRMKLDAAIEHILVDEAQDTTPQMWDIVKALSDDFFTGEGQARHHRSIFVVGDEKQSIFSFQGAEPRVFDEVRQYFSHNIRQGSEDLARTDQVTRPVRLVYSFRSSADILTAVDVVFARPEHRAGLSSDPEPPGHIAAHERFPGLVEIWPIEEPTAKAGPADDADAPVDAPSPTRPALRAAQCVADTIAQWLERGERHLSDGKRIEPGDILILAQRREGFFRAVLYELKLRGVPVAGADRLKLQDEIVIHDLIAIAAAALLPEDDLVLASVLKTPVFGLDDAALARLARQRPGSLRHAIMAAGEHDPTLAAINARLCALEGLARSVTPFAFFSDVLVQPCPARPGLSGRKAFLTRLGPDAADAIDAFMGEAIDFGRQGPPFLFPFITMMRARDTDIKRDLDQAKGQVRVMTAHASKGLEARIVFVCDSLRVPDKGKESAILVAEGPAQAVLLWAGGKGEEPQLMAAQRAAQRQSQFEEYRRLLYVAMTRAEERLYIVGHRIGTIPSADAATDPLEKSWHALVSDGLSDRPEMQRIEREDGKHILRWVSPTPSVPPVQTDENTENAGSIPPEWLNRPMHEDVPGEKKLRPSQGRLSQGQNGARDRQRGIAVHALYERLPDIAPEKRAQIGALLIRQTLAAADAREVSALLDPVLDQLSRPGLQALFAPPSRAEVAVSGQVALRDGSTYQVAGRIDRLRVGEGEVDILDLKSGFARSASDDAEIIRQMALYRALITQIYPECMVRAHVLWTRAGQLETLPPEALDAAFSRITPA